MADQPIDKTEAPAAVAAAPEAAAPAVEASEPALGGKEGDKPEDQAVKEEDKVAEEPKPAEDASKPAEENATEKTEEPEKKDVDMKDATETPAADAEAPAAETPTAKGKARRKSTADSKGKTLSKKASKARLTHTEAKPGDHFLVKLKGFPAWPAIISLESMLPDALLTSRPVTAARSDGTFTEAYADGGKRVNDRSFPVMYLSTNEFGWVSNKFLTELGPEKAQESITEKMRKDLKAAYELAAEHNSIDHYKQMLDKIWDDFEAQKKAAEEAAATPKTKKGKGKADEDVDMDDAEEGTKSAKSKKRKADDDTSTPQRSDSTKRPKIKLNVTSTPKSANGAATPKSKDDSKSKSKAKKAKDGADKKADTPKEVKMTPEERHARKEKEVLYLRHKLQRGLLTRDQQPQEAEMKQMSEFVNLLENFADLEVSIIRATKINKVLKAILKLDSIPREEEFEFKKRSQALLDKWNKLMASDGTPVATNGVNGTSETPNGVKESVEKTKSETPKPTAAAPAEDSTADKTAEVKETPAAAEATEKVASETPAAAAEPVEASA